MAKQLHVIHRHTANTMVPASGDTDYAKLALGEIAVQHNEEDPAIYIKVGSTSASTKYVKFTPGNGVTSIGVEGNPEELNGDVLFSSGETPTTAQTIDEVGFEIVSGVVKANIILDSELDETSAHAIANSAITKVIYENEETVAAALNDLNERISEISVTASGDNYVSASVAGGSAITISTNAATALTDGQASGSVADSKAVVDYVKSKVGAVKNITTIGSVAVPTSASTYTVVSGHSFVNVSTAASGASGIQTTIGLVTGTTSGSTEGLAVNTDVKAYIDSVMTSAMHFKGTTGELPASAESGDIWIVGTGFTIPNVGTAEVGDYIVYYQAAGQQGVWSIIEKNDTGVVTSSGLTSGAMVLADGSNSLVSAGTVGDSGTPIYLSSGVPTPVTFDTQLSTGSTNAVQNSAVTAVILENEEITAAALTDIDDRLHNDYYTKSEVDELIEESSAVVVNCGATITTADTTLATVDGTEITANISVVDNAATIQMSGSTATALATVGGQNITAKVAMNSLTIAGANGLADGITFDGKSDIEILTLDCGEY